MPVAPKRFAGWKKIIENYRQSQEERRNPVIPSRFEYFCESGQDMEEMPIGSLEKTSHKTKLFFTSYPRLQHVEDFIKELRPQSKLKSKMSSASFGYASNSIQQRIFRRLYVNQPLDQEWFQANDLFIHNLSLREKFALVAMTNKSQQHVQAYLRGSVSAEFRQRVRQWNTPVHGYLPIYFALQDMFPEHPGRYEDTVATLCPLLTDKQIDQCVEKLCQEIRTIFQKAPKTKKRMVLLRGIKSQEHKPSTKGFVSLTLDPQQALVYAGTQCCLQRVVVLPRTRMLFLGGVSSFPNDLECLLPDTTQFYDLGKKNETIPKANKIQSLCPSSKDTRRITIHDLVAL